MVEAYEEAAALGSDELCAKHVRSTEMLILRGREDESNRSFCTRLMSYCEHTGAIISCARTQSLKSSLASGVHSDWSLCIPPFCPP
jgi:hypothetical protein